MLGSFLLALSLGSALCASALSRYTGKAQFDLFDSEQLPLASEYLGPTTPQQNELDSLSSDESRTIYQIISTNPQ